MNQILEWLSGGDLRSDGLADEVAAAVLKSPDLFDDLYAGLSESDDVIRGRTADALEKISRQRPDLIAAHLPEVIDRQRPDLIAAHLPEVIDLSKSDQVPMVKMHLAMIFGHLALYEEHIDTLRSALFDLLDDESVFAKSWAIVSLCIIGRMYPQKIDRIVNRISQLQEDNSVAIRSRARKALNILTNPSASFPKGWIKSDRLK
jgi:HEAT repeat protein